MQKVKEETIILGRELYNLILLQLQTYPGNGIDRYRFFEQQNDAEDYRNCCLLLNYLNSAQKEANAHNWTEREWRRAYKVLVNDVLEYFIKFHKKDLNTQILNTLNRSLAKFGFMEFADNLTKPLISSGYCPSEQTLMASFACKL
jgi:hypothetical protein